MVEEAFKITTAQMKARCPRETLRRPAETKMPRKEGDVQRSVIELLKRVSILAFRMNSGAFSFEHKGKKRFFRAGCPGMADILAFPKVDGYPQPLWIEIKSSHGCQTREQELFQRLVESDGHTYLLARSAQEVYEWVKEHFVA